MPKVFSLAELRDCKEKPSFADSLWMLLGYALFPFSGWGRVFELTRHRLDFARLKKPVRVLQLSDFHFNIFLKQKYIKRWFDAALKEKADLILLTGDFIDYLSPQDHSFYLEQLERLKAPLGVWAVWGNHDCKQDQAVLEKFKQQLSHINIKVLVNEGVYVDEDLFLAGLDDARQGKPDLTQALKDYQKDGVCLLMSHVPDVIPLIPTEVDMTFCGHTHGGQVVLPLLGISKTSSYYGKQFAQGWIQKPVRAYVSRGLGYSTIPVRLNCPGEIAVFDFVPSS